MKVLFCGLGSIGQRHVRNLRALKGSEVEILAYRSRRASPVLGDDMTVQAGADLEKTYDLQTFDQLSDALAEGPEAVFITNPNTLHIPVALAAARAGCHLFIEKPVSHSLDGVRELIELVESNELVAFVAYQFRFHPGLRHIKAALEAGRLGQLASAHIVNGEYIPDWHPYEDYRQTHPARRELGGGSLRIQTHELDYAFWLFGMPKRVYAVGGHLSRLEIDVEDSVSLLLACEHDGRPFPVHVHLDYLQRPPQRVCEVVGDSGRLHFDYYMNHVVHHDTATKQTTVEQIESFQRNQLFLDELQHFLACISGQEAPLVNLREGVCSLQIALAAETSMQTGQAVELASSSTLCR